jgi:ABC-type taurine transport system ATPase subunit
MLRRRVLIVTHVLGERNVHPLAVELLGCRELEQVLEHAAAAPRGILVADELEAIAAVVDLDAELTLDLAQVLVELARKRREPARIVRAQDHAERVLGLDGGVRQRISVSRPLRGDPSMNCAVAR